MLIALEGADSLNKMTNPLRVILLSTAPVGAVGSMARYADLVSSVLSNGQTDVKAETIRINLAMRSSRLSRFPAAIRNWIHHAWVALSCRGLSSRYTAAIYHILDGSHGYVAKRLGHVPTVVTVHDIVPYLQMCGRLAGSIPTFQGRWLIKNSLNVLGHIGHIIADSNSTRHDLCDVAGVDQSKITTIHLALPALDRASSTSSNCSSSSSAFILHVGSDAFYKNRQGVVRVFARVRKNCPEVRLKLAGAACGRDLRKLIDGSGLTEDVDFITGLSDSELAKLYRRAALLLFPSFYEGFGWPPLEALACGGPVVCSNVASLPEVVGDAALTAPPEDEETLAQHCVSIFKSRSLARDLSDRGKERAKLFSPDRMAEGLLAVYQNVLDKPEEIRAKD